MAEKLNFNSIPLLITLSESLLLILVQQFLRPYLHPSGLIGFLLGSAPNFIIGFCFPFSILMRPKSFTRQTLGWLFALWCAGTFLILCWFEIKLPFTGAQTFDYYDIIASLVGVILAALFYYSFLQRVLVFGKAEEFEGDSSIDG